MFASEKTPNTERVVLPNEERDLTVALRITQFTVCDLGIDWEILRFVQDDVLIGSWALRRFWTWHQEHRARAVFQHAFSSTAYQEVIHRTVPMCTHYDYVGIQFVGLI